MKMRIAWLLVLFGVCCSTSVAQVPEKKDDLTVSDREEWRGLLKWPDDCEQGFQAYKQSSPPGDLTFNKLGTNEYLVAVGCSANVSLFMYYREKSRLPARLLKFREYDAAYGAAASPYSRVRLLAHSFNSQDKVLWFYSATSATNGCLMHKYRISHGRPVFLKARKLRCSDVI